MSGNGQRLLVYSVLAIALTFAVAPILGVLVVALQAHASVGGSITSVTDLTLDNFGKAWTAGDFGSSLRSSGVVALFAVPATTALAILAGYGIGSLRFRYASGVLAIFVFALMIPIEDGLLPLYYVWRALGLTDSYVAIIVTEIGYQLPFGVFWMAAAFASLPRELLDAARVDGASRWRTLLSVGAPVVLPAIVTLAALNFMWIWNDFLMPLIMISSESLRTAPLSISFFQGVYLTDITLMAAACVIVALPVVAAYVFLQRQFVAGATMGALKE